MLYLLGTVHSYDKASSNTTLAVKSVNVEVTIDVNATVPVPGAAKGAAISAALKDAKAAVDSDKGLKLWNCENLICIDGITDLKEKELGTNPDKADRFYYYF